MITRPLDLESKLNAPPRDLDMMFWVNVGVVMLFFSLLGSRFVLAPGLQVQVAGGEFSLPEINVTTQVAATVVVSYRRDDMVIFEGGTYARNDVRSRLTQYAKDHPGSVMLLRCDKAVSVQGYVVLCEMAREAGFASVVLAVEPPVAEESGAISPVR